MTFNHADRKFMRKAIELAQKGLWTTRQNPRVGAVIVKDGEIIGEGWHTQPGDCHAEIKALQQVIKKGHSALDACCYVSLEPCNHHGLTPPCSQALLDAGISEVVYAHEDPNPKTSGAGAEHLKSGGIRVRAGLMDREARALNLGFVKRMAQGLPWVRLKSAMSLDGRTAMASGHSFWITGKTAREDVQKLRAQSCAIISSFSTVYTDNARLNVRLQEVTSETPLPKIEQPLRVLIDSHAQLDVDALFFQVQSPILVVTALNDPLKIENAQKKYQAIGTHVSMQNMLLLNEEQNNRVDLKKLLETLASENINEVCIECGAKLGAAFFANGLVDELIVYMAPKVMGATGLPLFDLSMQFMNEALPLRIEKSEMVGKDLKLTLVPELE